MATRLFAAVAAAAAVEPTGADASPSKGAVGACRSPYTWPFNATSIWNTALGSGALFGATGLYPDDGSNRSTFFEFRHDDMSFVQATPTDPIVPWHAQGTGAVRQLGKHTATSQAQS